MWPWIARYPRQSIDLSKYKNVKSWYETIAKREAVQRGYNIFGPSELIP
jgi:GST-like protein